MNYKINFFMLFTALLVSGYVIGSGLYRAINRTEYPYSLEETKLPESPAIIISEKTHPTETYFVADTLNPFIAISVGYEIVMIDSSDSLHVFLTEHVILTDIKLLFPKERWRR